MPPYTQEHRLIRIATPLGGDELLITGFRGHEEISRLYHFELSLLSHNHSIDFKKIIGGNVTVSIALVNGEDRFINGIVASFSQSGGHVMADRSGGAVFSQYTATIVPWLWLLTKTSDLRIFQNKSVVQIIEQIFSEKGLSDYTKKLTGSYLPRDYCVQYRETDFNFVSRLMEEEGISYYFSHENSKHTLVLADASTTAYTPCLHHEQVRYQQASSGHGKFFDEDVIKTLALKNEIRVGKYSLNDYNFETPNTKLLVEVESRQHLGPGEKEVYDYPGRYTKRAEGDGFVKVRIEEEERRVATVTGTSDVRGFASGYSFTLEEYFRDEMNNKKYLLTTVDHAVEQQVGTGGDGESSYSNAFTCIPLDTPFRPPRLTPKPIVEGVQTAVVVGPAGEEIYTDKHGRIKVQFHWDREGKGNESSSCWIRVGQIWAGSGWGAMYIPRIGQEVIVDFLEGDPDRPIVIGCVYNAHNTPPYSLPDGKTKSTIKSNSSKGGGGFNEIRFEDKKGDEEIYIHGEKDETIVIENDKVQTVGHDESLSVGNDRSKEVGRDEKISVTRDETISIGRNLKLSVGKDRTESIEGNHTETIGKDMSLSIEKMRSMKVGKTYQVDIGEDHIEKVKKDYALGAKKITLQAQDQIEIKVGEASIIMKKNGDIEIKGKKIQMKGSGDVIIKGSKIEEN